MMAILHTERGKRIGARGYTFLTKWSNIGVLQRSNIGSDTTLNSCKTLTC
jgi:hypothetical protein